MNASSYREESLPKKDAWSDADIHLPKWVDLSAQSLLDATPDAMLVVNQGGEIVGANLQAEELFGYVREELIGRSVESLIPPRFRAEHPQHRKNFFDEACVRPMGMGLEFFVLRKDATEVPVEISLGPLANQAGTFVVTAIRNATDRRRSEGLKVLDAVLRETRESEERFRLIADSAPALMWMSGTDRLCTYVNKSWLDFTGRSMDSELGNGWAEGIHLEDLRSREDNFAQAFDHREEFRSEYRLQRHDGEYRWVLDIGVPRFDQDRSFVGYIGMVVDVTERKLAEKELALANQRLSVAMQAGQAGGWEWDIKSGRNLWFGETHALLGTTPEAHPGSVQEFWDRVHPEDCVRLHQALENAKQNHTEFNEEFRVVWPDGTVHWLRSQGRCSYGANAEPERMLGISIDITKGKLAEDALASVSRRLIEAQEQERSRIARDLHDDFGQRLALLTLGLELLQQDAPNLPAEVRRRIGKLGKQASKIATDIQSLSHELHSSKLEYVGVAAAVRGFCQEFGEQQKVEIEFKHHDLPTTLPPDVSLCLFRVLQEALRNSAKHSGVRHFEVRLWGASDEIHLRVRDSGSGFDREAAKQAQGLGLISMEERLRFLNGTLSIESQSQRGTTIHARVPLRSGSNIMRGMSSFTVSPIRDVEGRITEASKIARETSEAKRAQEDLQQAYAEVRQLKEKLQAESDYLQEEVRGIGRYEEIVGGSEALSQVLKKVEQVASTDSVVLITGESGTGKELVARAIHERSKRKDRVMVKVDCAALPATLIESELFGREKGAYTGALTRQIGRFETADGSTLFLDEIGELGVELQAKLLRVVQDGDFERLGSAKTTHASVRLIAATHRDLAERVTNGTFREDLFYRLNVFPIHVPPLRERLEDIPLLVTAFLREFEKKMGKRISRVPSRMMDELSRYPWPGNIRELRNVIERAVIVTTGEKLNLQLPRTLNVVSNRTLKEAECQHIVSALDKTGWRVKGPEGAAAILGMKPSTLYTTMRRLHIPTRHEKGGELVVAERTASVA